MCVTNVYVDQYPDGETVDFRQTQYCAYGQPGRPCQKLSTLENPVRTIQFGEPTTEFMMNTHRESFPSTPPRSSGGSHHRLSGDYSSEDGRRRRSKRRSDLFAPLRPSRQHRKERIVIVDSPPTPRTPPQQYQQTFTAPSSPATPPYIVEGINRDRARPIIVDERPLNRRSRAPSVGAVVGDRPRRARSQSRNRVSWDSPSISHTSFDSRARLEAEESARRDLARREREREERIAALEAERRRDDRIRAHDEKIRQRPAAPVPPAPLRHREYLRPVITQPELLPGMGGLTIRDERAAGERALKEAAEIRRRLEVRDREMKARREAEEEEALKQRLRERQMPTRRFSVGPAQRRHRVLYDDGVYRYE